MKKIVLILGMHRSATSLTTEFLASYGLYVGEDESLCKPDQSNQRGYFENRNAVWLNNKILYEHGIHWAEVQENANKVQKTKYSHEINEVLNNMVARAEDTQTLLLKDPRMCITEPVWKKQMNVLGIEEHIVMVFRHPYEVAKSLVIRDNMNFAYAMKVWFYYNFCALCCIKACDTPVLVLDHDDYFSAFDKQIRKIEEFLHWTGTNKNLDKIIDVTLRHNNIKEIHEKIDIELENMIIELYRYLKELSSMEKVAVSEKKLKYFSEYLRKMAITAYLSNGDDMSPKVFKNCLGNEKKNWCMYQLRNNIELLTCGFQYLFKKKNVINLVLYGNGTLARALLPILEKAGIDIDTIFEKNSVHKAELGKYQIKVVDINEVDYIEADILNTAVNYGLQIQKDLSERFEMCRILDLYDLIYECIVNCQ